MREHQGFLLDCLLFGAGLASAAYQGQAGGAIVADLLWLLVLGLAGLVLLMIALVRVVKRIDLPWGPRLVPLVGWALPLLASYGLTEYLTRLDRVPNWLAISNHESVGYASFNFKPDGRYKYATGSPLGLFYGYGRYVRRDSVLRLRPEPGTELPPDTLLIIRPYAASATPAFDTLARVLALPAGRYPSVYYIHAKR